MKKNFTFADVYPQTDGLMNADERSLNAELIKSVRNCIASFPKSGIGEVEALLKKGANRLKFNDNPLILALEKKSPELVKFLLDAGANPNVEDLHENNALTIATEKKVPN
jgi:ankyrin repeat protein